MKQFSGSSEWLKDLNGEKIGRLLAVASDVALVMADSRLGVIKDVSIGSDEIPVELAESWLGKQWIATVTIEWFEDRPSAERAELAAIRDEHPKHNIAGNPRQPAREVE